MLTKTVNTQLQQRDELRHILICTTSETQSQTSEAQSFPLRFLPQGQIKASGSRLMPRFRQAAICLCNCIAADIYRGRHRPNSSRAVPEQRQRQILSNLTHIIPVHSLGQTWDRFNRIDRRIDLFRQRSPSDGSGRLVFWASYLYH